MSDRQLANAFIDFTKMGCVMPEVCDYVPACILHSHAACTSPQHSCTNRSAHHHTLAVSTAGPRRTSAKCLTNLMERGRHSAQCVMVCLVGGGIQASLQALAVLSVPTWRAPCLRNSACQYQAGPAHQQPASEPTETFSCRCHAVCGAVVPITGRRRGVGEGRCTENTATTQQYSQLMSKTYKTHGFSLSDSFLVTTLKSPQIGKIHNSILYQPVLTLLWRNAQSGFPPTLWQASGGIYVSTKA